MKTASQNETSFSSLVKLTTSSYKNSSSLFAVLPGLLLSLGKSSSATLEMQLLIVKSSVSSFLGRYLLYWMNLCCLISERSDIELRCFGIG